MANIKAFIILGFLNVSYCQVHILFKQIKYSPYDEPDKSLILQYFIEHLFFWPLDRNFEGGICYPQFTVKYLAYFFSLLGVIVGNKDWSGFAIATLVFNFLTFLNLIITKYIIDGDTGLLRWLYKGKPKKVLLVILFAIIALYSYAEPALQIYYLHKDCPYYLICYYAYTFICSSLIILIP